MSLPGAATRCKLQDDARELANLKRACTLFSTQLLHWRVHTEQHGGRLCCCTKRSHLHFHESPLWHCHAHCHAHYLCTSCRMWRLVAHTNTHDKRTRHSFYPPSSHAWRIDKCQSATHGAYATTTTKACRWRHRMPCCLQAGLAGRTATWVGEGVWPMCHGVVEEAHPAMEAIRRTFFLLADHGSVQNCCYHAPSCAPCAAPAGMAPAVPVAAAAVAVAAGAPALVGAVVAGRGTGLPRAPKRCRCWY